MKNQNPHEETMEMNIPNDEIKEGLNRYKSFPEEGKSKKNMHTIHEKYKNYQCESCSESFPQAAYLEKHIYTIHESHRDHKCEYCGKSFPHSENLKQHNAICEKTSLKSQVEGVHEKERDHKCEEYKEENTKLKHENEILNSIIENLEEENKALKCHFSSMKNQNPHEGTMEIVENILQSNHEIKDEPLDYDDMTQKYNNCELYGNIFSNDEVKYGKISHNKCESCEMKQIDHQLKTPPEIQNEKISNKTLDTFLARPFNSEEWNPNKAFQRCKICERKFKNKKTLQRHFKEKHENRKYKCKNCYSEFAQSGHLSRHMKIHTDQEIKMKCEFCDKSFTRKDNLKLHLKEKH